MEKRYDGAEALSAASGLPKTQVLELWEQVKQNKQRLDGCEGPHRFERDGREFRCGRCGGTVSAVAYAWYLAGLEHGRKALK